MKFKLYFLFFLSFLLVFSLQAQTVLVNDDFEDGDILGWTENVAGHWTASTTTPINGGFSCKHNLAFVAGTSWISRQLTADPTAGDMTWEFQLLNGNWDPSSTNRYWFYLMSDQANIGSGTADGYAVGINMNFASDLISLYRVTNGAHDADLITSGATYNWDNSEVFGIRVTRSSTGNWELFVDDNGGFDNLVSTGTATDVTYTTANPHTGLFFEYTSSRAGQLWLDDVRIETTEGMTPDISLSVNPDSVRECGEVAITVSASLPVSGDKTFTLSTSGDAASGDDYVALPATITILDGNTTGTITLQTHCDSVFEVTETLALQIGSNGQTGINMVDSTDSVAILDYVRVMHYNLLRYPSATDFATKNADLKIIIDYLEPDIFGVNELDALNGDENADSILTGALNVNGRNYYQRAAHQNTTGSPISNMLFYNSRKFVLHNQLEIIIPGERNPNVYELYYNYPNLATTNDTIWLKVIEVHLKAGQNASDSLQRITVADSIMDWMQRNGPENFLLMGDFNVYTSTENAYQFFINYTADPSVQFTDPINTPGDWNNNGAFAAVHTQSTRSSFLADGGAGGGMDDRFDFILNAPAIQNGTDSIRFLPGTYEAVGQDGLRFNGDINSPANSLVPSAVADALFSFSDHLPVIEGLDITWPGQTTLDVAWDYLVAEPENNVVTLRWATHREENADYFRIERSLNGSDFETIGRRDAVGNSEKSNAYRFQDARDLVFGKPMYYRVAELDLDGGVMYSEVVAVTLADADAFLVEVYPVPARDRLQVRISGKENQAFEIRMLDLQGKTVRGMQGTGNAVHTIGLAELRDGIYLLEVRSGHKALRRKILVQK